MSKLKGHKPGCQCVGCSAATRKRGQAALAASKGRKVNPADAAKAAKAKAAKAKAKARKNAASKPDADAVKAAKAKAAKAKAKARKNAVPKPDADAAKAAKAKAAKAKAKAKAKSRKNAAPKYLQAGGFSLPNEGPFALAKGYAIPHEAIEANTGAFRWPLMATHPARDSVIAIWSSGVARDEIVAVSVHQTEEEARRAVERDALAREKRNGPRLGRVVIAKVMRTYWDDGK